MNTTKSTLNENISNNERGFRGVLAIGMLGAIIVGLTVSPASIFALAMISIYLVMTAVIGIDPAYAARETLTDTVGTCDATAR